MENSEPLSTKERLFSAAIKIFAQRGYRQATVRDICRLAGAANVNAVNYYFGSKERLYRSVLETMFAEIQKRSDARARENKDRTGKERLRDLITEYCTVIFSGGDTSTDLMKIFISEMTRPSPYLDEMVTKYTFPHVEEFLGALRDIMGPDTPREVLRDCGASIVGQIVYYSLVWPVFSRVFTDHPGMEQYHERLAEHVFRFSLGGLKAAKARVAAEKRSGRSKRGEGL
ncbi:MAG: CerR family C-terminal domain-containing protein [Deltaproteobacteria bacterium]|nr:CerR family C-terminal domain-containing protein [Deltaproteobacteria bacterium]